MNEIILTKDGDILICAIYAKYLKRRKNGMDKAQAIKNFKSLSVRQNGKPLFKAVFVIFRITERFLRILKRSNLT